MARLHADVELRGQRADLVDRAEGHEVIDVDGRRYLDAISSLWVTTLGHAVPELDEALTAQLARGAHTTMLGNGNRVVVELSEALARVVPVDDAALPLRVRRRVRGRAGAEDRVPVLGEPRRRRAARRSSRFGGAYHGDTIGALSVGAGGFGTDLFDPLRFPVLRAPDVRRPRLLRRPRAGWSPSTRRSSRR